MTEEEAKTKWCPAFRGNNHGVNRPDELKTDAGLGFCVGSACMAWRSEPGADRRRLEAQYPCMPMGEIAKIESGWCGLAGKP